jgi:hypothetical protein
MAAQPVTHSAYGVTGVVVVRANVLTGNVGTKIPIAVTITIEDKTTLFSVVWRSVSLCTKKKSQLQWHVEARKLGVSIESCTLSS